MFKMYRTFLFLLGMLTVFSFAYMCDPVQRSIKLSDIKDKKERESLEHYLYQGYWRDNYVWIPKWIKIWRNRNIQVPTWKRIWIQKKTEEWVTVRAKPPAWLKNVRGHFVVKV
ncbi:PREDICTED: uncharacterized protein LOC106126219 [Papilio xuthus]|uniref:Uncharacterized protein LOC106126219 n=1 Tax=Papilio xuthus TaxID=66420 RepID=A0A194PT49_PAPXU|nr:PREDICTED: uncharacterized protein LOC106126219 [Papilio xuthus]KPI96143.1 hypothetical protein RR46_06877 [Papilio xuthus]